MMRPAFAAAALLAATSAASCAHPPAGPGPGARPEDCSIEFYWKAPKRAYTVLGEVSGPVTARKPGAPPEALRPPACALGADAVVVTQDPPPDQYGRAHLAGTAIRFDPAPPAESPPARPADIPSTAL